MNRRGRLVPGRVLLATGLLAAGLWLNPFAGADAPPSPAEGTIPFEGTQAFRRFVLHDLFKLTPLRTPGELGDNPKDTLLIVLGETAVLGNLGRVTGGLTRFQARGGALLIASDRDDHGVLAEWGLSIDGRPVHETAEHAYRNIPECPLLMRFSDSGHPLFQGLVRGIATNQPSFVRPWNGGLRVRAAFSPDCRPTQRLAQDTRRGPLVFLVAGTREFGPEVRMVVLAGHGVFMNGMIGQRDNDNFTFACNCIRWLTEGGKRRRVLFVEDGTVQSALDVPLRGLPAVPVPSSRMVNKILRGLEEERFFDRLLLKVVPHDRLFGALVLLSSVGLLVYATHRLFRARHQVEPAVPLLAAGDLATADEDFPLMTRRDRDVVRGGNLWEAARVLARTCFDQASATWPGHAARVPSLVVAGGWLRRSTLARQVRRLWHVAHAPTPVPVSPRQFVRIAALVRTVRAALADGTLRWQGDGQK